MPAPTLEATPLSKHLVALVTNGPATASAEFRIGLRSAPDLADHGFQDMVVLPGACYVAMARHLEQELGRSAAHTLRNVTFLRPLVLSADDTLIRVEVREQDGRVEYAFAEKQGVGYAATLTCDRDAVPARSVDAVRPQGAPLDAAEFYRQLRANGNQYGPSFQRVVAIWRAGDGCIGRLAMGPAGLEPSFLDAATQLLASLTLGHGKTFILRSIERVEFADAAFDSTDALWGRATLRPTPGAGNGQFVGDVAVYDDAGRRVVELGGVNFAFLERVADGRSETAATRLVIAGNFTAEPIEDALRFWADEFGVRLDLEFAPHDQVFQQLLDRRSALHRNKDGVNAILLSLEEWIGAVARPQATLKPSPERVERCLGDRRRCVLPNGLEIAHLNQYETDYLYQEIFEDETYLKHGIRLPDKATVVDIGANIGMFSLFVLSRCADPTIYAFEPAPQVYDLLKANGAAYGRRVHALNMGAADKAKSATFTFYERSSVFSGFHTDDSEDREAIQAVVRNTLRDEVAVAEDAVESYVAQLTAERLRRTTHECRLISVSDLIREHRIDKIDLLKVDAEKSELEILAGIEDGDWPKIAQIVLEIHDRTRKAGERVEQLLTAKGYRCVLEEERLLGDSGLFNLYATRGELVQPVTETDGGLERNVRDLCSGLRALMGTTAAPLVVCIAPRTPAAGADATLQAKLDAAEQILLREGGAIPRISVISSASLQARYPVEEAYDSHSHHLAHIPYTREGYAAIGTALFRAVVALKGQLYKVIVLDCDNTLWKGVCGEDGPLGVEVTDDHRRLQRFLIDQLQAGMLLCLCSKNNEQDVLDVFERHPDMVLRREHLAAWRIDWRSKSDNIKALARDLDLGLDSFIFLDDSPVECAEVCINCPDVLTLQLPVEIDHVWAFDRRGTKAGTATEEDRRRTQMYQQNAERQRLRERTRSLKDFIDGLDLRIAIADAKPGDLARVSQLTYRTNQFNLTTVRRSEQEIRTFLARENATGLVVRVSDRFGDYGLVGVVLYEMRADRLTVDTLLISCRVLGRGVEHALVAELGRRAIAAQKPLVELPFRPTEKNAPAREFLARLGPDGAAFAAELLAGLTYDPDATVAQGPTPESERDAPRSVQAFGAAPLQRIAERLGDIAKITRAIEQHRGGLQDEAPREAGSLEMALLRIWRRVLGRSATGLSDNFFEAGGTSLRAIQVLAAIKRELGHDLSIVTLFECPTVNLLAARLRTAPGGDDGTPDIADAAQRGARRRVRTVRHAS